MANEVLDLQAELQRDLANMANTIVKPTGQKIKITAGRWALPNGKTSIEPLRVIVLGWRWINRYYPRGLRRGRHPITGMLVCRH